MRLLPSFMIIGGVKCGTSSVYRYLTAHPEVLPCKSKEPNYFSFRAWYKIPFSYHKYKRMFPRIGQQGEFVADWLDLGEDGKMHASQFHKAIEPGKKYLTGEATATTVFAANPSVIKWLLPKLKVIMLLRDPVQRYVSHYRMYERFKKEGRKGYDFAPLEEYVQKEIELFLQKKKTRILHQGLYSTYLKKWEKVFGRENLLLLRTRDFEEVREAQAQMETLCNFLGLNQFDFTRALDTKYNRAPETDIPVKVEKMLREFYLASLQELRSEFSIEP